MKEKMAPLCQRGAIFKNLFGSTFSVREGLEHFVGLDHFPCLNHLPSHDHFLLLGNFPDLDHILHVLRLD